METSKNKKDEATKEQLKSRKAARDKILADQELRAIAVLYDL